jgi:hypothetical protein
MFNEFIFDQSVASFTNSKLFWQFTKNGVPGQVQSAQAVLSADQPNAIYMTIPTSSIAGNDTLITYVQLIDSAQKTLPSTQQFSNDLSLLKVLSDNQSAISSLTSQIAQSKAQAATATAANNALIASLLPRQVVKTADVESDHAIELTFTTDRPGRLRVTNTTTGKFQDTQQGTTHTVLFDQLGYSTLYAFTGVVLDQQDHLTTTQVPPFSIQTRGILPEFNPQVTVDSIKPGQIDIAVVADSSGSFSLFTPSLKTAFTISYRQIVNASPATYGPVHIVQAPPLDLQSYPLPDSLSTTSQFPIPGLAEGQNYLVSISAVDQFGQPFKLPDTTVSVKKSLAALDFDGPVTIQITAANGLSASWKATAKPTNPGVVIQFGASPGDKLELSAASDATNPQLIKLSSPDADLSKVITAAMSGATPTIIVQMTDPNSQKVVDRQFIFSVGVQSANKSSAPKTPATQASASSAAQKLVDASNQPTKNKVSWQDLLASGLGIVLKAI